MFDIRQTLTYANYLSKIGWIVERKNKVNYFIKRFPLIGSVLKIQRPKQINYSTIQQLIRKYRIFQIIIEPKDKYQVSGIKYHGFKLSKTPYLPTKTLQLDLTKSEKYLFNHLKKDCRSAVNRNYQLPIFNFQQKDINKFRNCWKSSVPLKRYIPPLSNLIVLKRTFKEDCIIISYDYINIYQYSERGRILSGAIFLKTKDTGYYWQAFTNKEGRRAQIQYKIVWEGIMWAKNAGCKVFDFEGIYDERFPNKSWKGFTHFKKSFGGREIIYPGCYTKWNFPYFT